jgi:hypothetical protein
MGGVCVPFVAIAAARPSKGLLRKSKFSMARRSQTPRRRWKPVL